MEDYEELWHKAKRELHEREEELMAQHEELTAAIESVVNKNDELERVLSELKSRNKELDQIIYRTSHDLKSPITTMRGLINLISAEAINPEIRAYTQMAVNSTLEMEKVLFLLTKYSWNLLDNSRLETINVYGLIKEAISSLRFIDGVNDVNIKVSDEKEHPEVITDSERLQLVLFQVISNAVHFRNRSIKTEIAVDVVEGELGLDIAVTDNGIGMSQDIMDRAFEMFYRGATLSKGPGLGLYISHQIMKKLRGKILLSGVINQGSVVTVRIPYSYIKGL